jgi:hypothetical protein
MKCFMKNGVRKEYKLRDQYERCGELSTTKTSVSSITSTLKELVDVATDMTVRTSAALIPNTSQEYTTTLLPEDIHKGTNERDKASTFSTSKDPPRPNDNKEQEYTTTLLSEDKRTNENDKASTVSTSKDPPGPSDNKELDNSEEGASGTHITRYSETSVGTQATREIERIAASKSEKEGSPQNDTLKFVLILSISLGGAVFVSLIAVNYVTVRCGLHRPQRNVQEASHDAACSHSAVPLVNSQVTVNSTRQGPGYRSSSGDLHPSAYHVYEEIC